MVRELVLTTVGYQSGEPAHEGQRIEHEAARAITPGTTQVPERVEVWVDLKRRTELPLVDLPERRDGAGVRIGLRPKAVSRCLGHAHTASEDRAQERARHGEAEIRRRDQPEA